jgi:hypothetical protein
MKSAKSLSPYTAFETKAECEDSLLARWQRTRDQWIEAGGGETKVHPDLSMSEVSSTPGRVTITRKGQKGNLLEKTTFWYQCWPDTIDPRGPKGSER